MNKDNINKKEVLKLLGIIGIDTRYISYTPNIIYINDQRFAKFSKKRQETFKKYYPEIEIVSSGILRKICIKFSEIISNEISPKNNVLILKPKNKVDYLLKIVLEPYTRKYGINIIEYDIDDIESFISNLNSEKPFFLNINELENIHDLKFMNRKRKEEKKEKECKEREEKEETKEEEKKKKSIGSDNIVIIDSILTSLTLDEKIESILSSIFKGKGIPISSNKNNINNKINTKNYSNTNGIDINNNTDNNINNNANNNIYNNTYKRNKSNNDKKDNKQTKVVYPFINVPNSWVDTFLDSLDNELNSKPEILNKSKDVSYPDNDSSIEITKSFMEFIEEIIPQYKWNILKSSNFIEEKLNDIKND
ncbi:hypothetical protein [Methanobrevibacter arboriphilus]|uniref:hypothetical protein n=1 Tax=Methanobrevibacter arboriphilus TaxID=39441 RepID=UPI000694FF9A|nr:hypothetical protein [Methanobrevibacter arboriphilus]